MKIIFKDFYDKEISEVQSRALDDYSKVFIAPGGQIKKEETYVNHALERIDYYKDANETDDEAREVLEPCGVSYSIRQREKYGNEFTIIVVDSYTDDLLTQKWNFLGDGSDFIICTQAVSLDSRAPVNELTNKYLGEYSDDEPNYCKFNYDSDGNFTYCVYNYVRDYECEMFESDRISLIRDKFELTDEMYNYFLTAELLPPLT